MIERISELPFFGPEEQLRKFVCRHEDPDSTGSIYIDDDTTITQQAITQRKIGNIDKMLQQQIIWSYGKQGVDDAYFYWDWVPSGSVDFGEGIWQMDRWDINEWISRQTDLTRPIDGRFSYKSFRGYTNNMDELDEMPLDYDAELDQHAKEQDGTSVNYAKEILDDDEYLRNMMRSYIEVSEWLGDGATAYGSHNGYVSRKMSMCWLFDAIRALINFKLNVTDKYAEQDIHPLNITEPYNERFLKNGEVSATGQAYDDELDLDQLSGHCALQKKVRSSKPNENGIQIIRGNEWHYGERSYYFTHNSFIGECRFFHNTRFLGQAVFDKEITGTAMRSRWGDICEYYEADVELGPGTLVMFGGEKQITLTDGKVCNAIVTTKPGLILNGGEQEGKTMVGIALAGQVPVKLMGVVKKFDKLVPSKEFPGYARKRHWYDFFKKTIGIALEASSGGMVNCVTKLDF